MPELPFVMEDGDRMVRAAVDGEILAKQGAMVAYTGSMDFSFKGAGLGGFVRKAMTGEGQELMKVTGRGNVWFADNGSQISLFTLDADRLVVNGRALLLLGQGMGYEIKKTSGGLGAMAAGGLFQTEVTGSGQVAVTCIGTPLVLPTDEPVFVDANAAVAWTSPVRTEIVSTFKAGALIGRGSGEAFQMKMQGAGGFVVVQCGEVPLSARQ
jgi:uncharacterized protein (AIM24 family)